MWAMMPMFRVFSKECERGISKSLRFLGVSSVFQVLVHCSAFYVLAPRTLNQNPAPRTPNPEPLPSVMRKRLVGFRHAVRIFTLLHRAAAKICRVEELVGEFLLHRLAVATRAR